MQIRPIDIFAQGKYYIDFLTSIHGENPFEVRFVPNQGFGTTSLLRKGDSIYKSKLSEGKGIDSKAKFCAFNPEEFGRAILDEFLEVSTIGDGCSVFFTINSPNFDVMDTCVTSDVHVKEGGLINSQFIDIDAPKTIRDNNEKLKLFKKQVKQKILSSAIKPSGVIETKHGYHVYWFVNDGKPELFRHVQLQLIQAFDGDENCINESRSLRLPYFMHVKDRNEPFPVTIKMWKPETVYNQKYLKDNLPELTDDTLEILKKMDSNQPSMMCKARKEDVLELVLEKLDYKVENDNKVITHCCMPYHYDKKPSAWIDKSYMFYHCQSCGRHLPLEELAKELEWQDVLDEINRYDIYLDEELDDIKLMAKNVNELVFDVDEQDKNKINSISETVIEDFKITYNQSINEKHEQYIRDIVTLLVKAPEQQKTTLIPLEMGGGKSTIIKVFLQQMLKYQNDYGAVVVVDRTEDAKKLAEEINDYFGSDKYALALYGFNKEECLHNVRDHQMYKHCPVFTKNFNHKCNHKSECRYFQQGELHKHYPVLIVTKKRINLDFGRLEKYKFFGVDEDLRRTLLIFDEKPSLVTVKELRYEKFNKYNNYIREKFISADESIVLEEFQSAINDIQEMFDDVEIRELIVPLNKDFRFSETSIKIFRKHFSDYTNDIFEYPSILESIIRNGGHRETTTIGNQIFTSIHQDYSDISSFNTFIFDGTADIDLEYNHNSYNLANFEQIRTYEGLEINICNTISASRTSLSDSDKIEAFCNDVISICEQNPKSKVYIPTFLSYEKRIEGCLKEYLDKGQVLLAHYGATKGSNKFKDCDIVAICGILHKSENYYIAKAKAIYEQKGESLDNISCSRYDNVRRFNDNRIETVKLLDMLADYSQEIKRSSQRNNAENVKGRVYIFHNDKLLLENIALKFPKCSINEWYPQSMIENAIVTKGNNPKQMAFIDYINECEEHGELEIRFVDIRENLEDMPTKGFSKLITNQTIQDFLKSREYVIEKDGRSKKLVKV